jgi:hypothetical protein
MLEEKNKQLKPLSKKQIDDFRWAVVWKPNLGDWIRLSDLPSIRSPCKWFGGRLTEEHSQFKFKWCNVILQPQDYSFENQR